MPKNLKEPYGLYPVKETLTLSVRHVISHPSQWCHGRLDPTLQRARCCFLLNFYPTRNDDLQCWTATPKNVPHLCNHLTIILPSQNHIPSRRLGNIALIGIGQA